MIVTDVIDFKEIIAVIHDGNYDQVMLAKDLEYVKTCPANFLN